MFLIFWLVFGRLLKIAGLLAGRSDSRMKDIGTEGLGEMAKKKPQRTVTITRFETDDMGTFGDGVTNSGFSFYSGELPWRNNEKGFSCIPEGGGTYECALVDSPKFGEVYEVKNVAGRSFILLHPGNWCGDVTKNLKSDVEGCILLGNAISFLAGQKQLLSSRDAFNRFMADLDGEPFLLTIKWKPEIKPKEEA